VYSSGGTTPVTTRRSGSGTPPGQLTLIARESDTLPRTSVTIYVSGTLNLRALAINKAGTVAFRATGQRPGVSVLFKATFADGTAHLLLAAEGPRAVRHQ